MAHPAGKRWKFSLISDGAQMIMFGGARLWHGFSSDNSVDNGWDSFDLMPEGGFMDDMYVTNSRCEQELRSQSSLSFIAFIHPSSTLSSISSITFYRLFPFLF